jgi:hypothetical protein
MTTLLPVAPAVRPKGRWLKTTSEPTKHTSDLADPYDLNPRDIQNPPTRLTGRLRFLGPGVITASAYAFSSLLPIGDDPYAFLSIGTWVAVLVVVAIAVHVANKYIVVERVSTALVFLVTGFAVVMVFLLRSTEFSWTAGDLADGMRFQIALGAMGVALSMFGLTGVGAGEITAYTYWCVEKGYAAWTGPNDGSDAWAERARGWI